METESQSISREAEILIEIKESEKKADDAIETAKKEKESIIHGALADSSRLLAAKEEEIRKLQEKKVADFREKAKLIREEKIAESRNAIKQIKAKADKNAAKAVDFIIRKFEERV